MGGSRGLTVALLMLASCIKPSELACGDLICAPGSTCLPNGRCASAADVSACDGLAEGSACTTSLFTGSCVGGACSPAVCGDGVVEGTEECDGSVTGVDCVDYGYDLGVPACNARCDLDVINTCTRFGWQRILSEAVNAAWTDGHRLAVTLPSPGGVELYLDGQLVASNPNGVWVTGNAQRVVAFDYDNDIVASTGGEFVIVDPPAGNGAINQVELAADDALYALEPGCQIMRQPPGGGAWQEIRASGATNCEMIRATGGKIYASIDLADTTGRVEVWSGQGETWTLAFTAAGTVEDLRLTPGGTVWVASYDGGFGPVVGAGVQSVGANGIGLDVIAPVGDLVYVSTGGSTIYRADVTRTELLEMPVEGEVQFDAAGNLYAIGNGVYRYLGTEYSDRTGESELIADIALLSDGTCAVATGEEVDTPDGNDDWNDAESDLTISSVTGTSANDLYVTDGESFEHYDGNNFVPFADPGFMGVTDLWLSPGGDLYAVASAAASAVRIGTSWHALAAPAGTTGCDVAAITGTTAMIIAVGGCGESGTVWQLAGMTWTEIYRGGGPLAGVTITSDGQIFATGPTGGARYDGSTWTLLPQALGGSISSTTSSDVWVGGGPNGVVHWDGMTWSRLNVVGASNPFVVATPHAVYIAGAEQSVLAR